MKLAINQPTFLPWPGFFALADKVDIFVIFDDVQMPDRSLVRRVKFPEPNFQRDRWLSASISSCRGGLISQQTIIKDLFVHKHLAYLNQLYSGAPFFKPVESLLERIYSFETNSLMEFNFNAIKEISLFMGLKTQFLVSSECKPEANLHGKKKLQYLIRELRPNSYFNFKNGVDKGLYDPTFFETNNVSFYKQDFVFSRYTDRHFLNGLSVIDLLFFLGHDSLGYIRKSYNWVKV